MKIPKTFIPEKNTEKSLEKILSKKFYTINKEGDSIKAYSFNGELLGYSKPIGEPMNCLETFNFANHKIFTVKFGDNSDQRAIFDERLNPVIMTPKTRAQTYCIFERKKDRSLLMVNFTTDRTKYTKITYFEHDGTKLEDKYHELHDILTNKAFVLKTKEENYLTLCFNYHALLIDEDLHPMLELKTEPNVNDINVANMKGEERIIALCVKDERFMPEYQVLRIFDNRLKLLEELNTKDFKPTLPTDDPWHDKLLSFKPYRIGSKDYFLATVERKKEMDRADLKVLNQDFEEVFQLEDIIQGRFNVEKFDGKDHLFVRLKKGEVVNVYDKDFNLEDEIPVAYSSLHGRYKILEIKGANYFAYVNEGYLTLHSGKIPFYGSHWTNKKVASTDIKLRNIDGLKKIIPFEYKGKDFFALEYEKNRGADVYDEDFKFVRSFPGGDFCIA